MTDQYIEYFRDRGIREELAAGVRVYLREWMNKSDFPVRPDHDIYKVYGIVDEDLDDFVISLADNNGLQLPASTAYWKSPVVTVQDLLDFVSSFAPKSEE